MDLQELEQLIAGGESDRLESKRSTAQLREGMQSLCGFANEQGGRVLLGVANNGRVLGQQFVDSTFRDVARDIQKFEPPVQIQQHQVPYRDNLEVLILEVERGEDGPYQYDGRVYQRIGTTTQRMPAVEYERRLLQRLHSQHRWENHIAEGFAVDDLDLDKVKNTLRIAIENGRLESVLASPSEALTRLGLEKDGRVLQAAVVAYGKRFLPHFSQCSLRLARFKGTTRTEFLDQNQLVGHAFDHFGDSPNHLIEQLP